MKKLLILAVTGIAALLGSCAQAPESDAPVAAAQGPHLEKRGNVTQLIVQDKPFLALACELSNSAASSRAYMAPKWAQLKEKGLNTILATMTWEQVEPVEGQFDFSVIDGIITDAREAGLKLVFLWFGSWKNGYTSYVPMWVQKDTKRFPLALTKDGKQLSILSTLNQASWEADAKAYAATMKHIKEFDAAYQTVIMIQMENEVGLHGYTRDYRPEAIEAFNGPVPEKLIQYLSANKDKLIPETREAWEKNGCRTSGSWEEVFGKGDYTDEMFMAWNYSSYMDKVSAAGKAEYNLPTFVNAWIVQPEDLHPGNYPSGGPQAQNHEIWRAGAPNIDILSPDIYLTDFPGILDRYSRANNPVFIPESHAGQGGAANAAYAIGQRGAIGYSPFGFDRSLGNAPDSFEAFYKAVGSCSDLILEAQASGNICAAWLKGANPVRTYEELTLGDWTICCDLVSTGRRNGGAPQLTGGAYAPDAQGYAIIIKQDNGFLVLGSNTRVTFKPADGNGTAGLGKVTEGEFVDGEWIEGRWLNGDEIQLRYDLLQAAEEGFSGQGLNFGNQMPQFLKVELFKY